MDTDTRFFTMNQLWQSLGIAAVVGVIVIGGMSFLPKHEPDTTAVETVAPATSSESAAVVTAIPAQRNPFDGVNLSGQAAIVVDLSNGRTLFSQNADAALPLASLTKLITLYGAMDTLSPTDPVTISSTSLAQDGDYGMYEGELFTFTDLSRLALVGSVNDAAEAIAETAAARQSITVPEFMAQSISKTGLSRTTAVNGTGLDTDLTHASAFGSARDISKLASGFLAKAPDLAKATTKRSVAGTSLSGTSHSYANTNYDVASMPGIQLSKTGYTDLAGGNLVIIFDAAINHPIAVVVLGSTRDARFTDVEKLIHATLLSLSASS